MLTKEVLSENLHAHLQFIVESSNYASEQLKILNSLFLCRYGHKHE